ncbi:hypothetical protein ZIOFF_067436 [Zingiber officinale]|uniref:Uncharacterized protein n=1 Tax=Zingiber officinale TaxID=94328 RepID=A0A8J5CFK5_ZINOF|nr:hypothetical protein ZIOFF_067436 [Zingiber officinale]
MVYIFPVKINAKSKLGQRPDAWAAARALFREKYVAWAFECQQGVGGAFLLCPRCCMLTWLARPATPAAAPTHHVWAPCAIRLFVPASVVFLFVGSVSCFAFVL